MDNNQDLVGTPNYMSLNAHKGRQLSRRDDIESAIYVLIKLFKDQDLPWSEISNLNTVKKMK